MRTELWSVVPSRRFAPAAGALALLAVLAAVEASAEEAQDYEDFFGGYAHRVEGVTVGAGDAAASNAASQIINPWPPYSRDRHILGQGARMTGAIQRYQANSGAKAISVPSMTQSRDAEGSGEPADTGAKPDAAKAPSSDGSAGE